jgi:hypothetical protein
MFSPSYVLVTELLQLVSPAGHWVQTTRVIRTSSPTTMVMAGVAVGMGRMERAAHLFAAADALRRRIGTPVTPAQRARYERRLALARDALGPERWTIFWAEGQAAPLEQAIAYALEEHAEPPSGE